MDTLVGGIRSGSFGHQSWWAVSGRVFFAVPPLAFTVTTLEDTLGFKVGGSQLSQGWLYRGGKETPCLQAEHEFLGLSIGKKIVFPQTEQWLSQPAFSW